MDAHVKCMAIRLTKTLTGCFVGVVAVVLVPGLMLAQNLVDLYRISKTVSGSHVEYHRLDIPKGGEFTLADLKGPGKVTYFYITDNSAGLFYPGLVLRVFWDEEKEPSIHVPLGDFFGAFQQTAIEYQSIPMQVNHLAYMCYLPMPFSRRARFVLANDGDENYSRPVAYGIDYETGQEYASEASRLHAVWRRSNPTRDGMHTILEARGHGHYIGNFLQVGTHYRGWWGEGDTIFHIDGKAITHSPGTEDEYGSCWGFGSTFTSLYVGYIQKDEKPRSDGGIDKANRMYRWYLANPVRFQRSIKVEIQNQRFEKGQVKSQDDYTGVAYWYQVEPHASLQLVAFRERIAPSRAVEYDGSRNQQQ
jgi:hypothetical protein